MSVTFLVLVFSYPDAFVHFPPHRDTEIVYQFTEAKSNNMFANVVQPAEQATYQLLYLRLKKKNKIKVHIDIFLK